jgi:hypothetical protein
MPADGPGGHRPQRVCLVIADSDTHRTTLRFIHNPGSGSLPVAGNDNKHGRGSDVPCSPRLLRCAYSQLYSCSGEGDESGEGPSPLPPGLSRVSTIRETCHYLRECHRWRLVVATLPTGRHARTETTRGYSLPTADDAQAAINSLRRARIRPGAPRCRGDSRILPLQIEARPVQLVSRPPSTGRVMPVM